MPAPSLGAMIQVGIGILKTVRSAKTKIIVAQTGDAQHETREADDMEWWQHVGFVSRPSKPIAGQSSSEGVAVRRTDHDAIIASRDKRGMELAGELEDGETTIYAAGATGTGQARAILKANGDLHLYTRKGNTASGGGMTVQLDATNDTIRIINSVGHGMIVDADGVKIITPASAIVLGKDGVASMVGNTRSQIDGASVVLGNLVAPAVNNAITGPTGIAGKASLKVMIE